MKLLVWSVFSHLCQDKGSSSSSSPCVKVDGGENTKPSPKRSSMDSTRDQDRWGRGRAASGCLDLKLQTHFGAWGQSPWSHGDEGHEQGVWGVHSSPAASVAVCAPCSLQLTQEPRLHSETWAEWEHLGQSFFSYSISWGYSWVRLSGLQRHCSAQNRCSFSLRKITHK